MYETVTKQSSNSATTTVVMDPITGMAYEPIEERLVAYIHARDPEHFRHSIAGMLWFIKSNLTPPDLSVSPSLPGDHLFNLDFPKAKVRATFTYVYRRWAATSPDALRLRRDFSIQGRDELSQEGKLAIYCAKGHSIHHASRQQIMETVQDKLHPKEEKPLSIEQIKSLNKLLQDLPPLSSTEIYLPIHNMIKSCHCPLLVDPHVDPDNPNFWEEVFAIQNRDAGIVSMYDPTSW